MFKPRTDKELLIEAKKLLEGYPLGFKGVNIDPTNPERGRHIRISVTSHGFDELLSYIENELLSLIHTPDDCAAIRTKLKQLLIQLDVEADW